MPGRTRVVDGSGQLSLLDEAPAPGAGPGASGSGRVFVSPDRGRLRPDGVPVGELLRESGDVAPLAVAEFLDGLDRGAFERAYAVTGPISANLFWRCGQSTAPSGVSSVARRGRARRRFGSSSKTRRRARRVG